MQDFWPYFAGFFDADGHLVIRWRRDARYRAGGRYELKLGISQKDRRVLAKIRDELQKRRIPGKIHIYYHRNLWYLEIYSKNAIVTILKRISPYLLVKREKARQVFTLMGVLRPETGANPP